MANTKLTALTALTSVVSADEIYIVDKSDTTDGADGTSKRITVANLIDSSTLTLSNKTLTSPTINTPTIDTGVISTSLDMNGTRFILDADADTSITADTDDQIDIEIAGSDDFQFLANTFLLQPGSNIDMGTNGNRIDFDTDNDTSLRASSDDTLTVEIAGADDFQFTANTFTALSGSSIATNTIVETTGGSGVTIDGVLVKDNEVILDSNKALKAKQAGGTAVDLVHLGTDDRLRLAQISLQNITTNSVLEDLLIQHGWGFDQPGAASSSELTITFEQTYSSLPTVYVSQAGMLDGSDPTEIDDLIDPKRKTIAHTQDITTSNFVVDLALGDGTNFGANERIGFTWFAIGVKT